MTVESLELFKQYTATGENKEFPITFPFYKKTHIKVYAGNTLLRYPDDYDIAGGNGSNGTLILPTKPVAGTKYTILRELPLLQLFNLLEFEGLPAQADEQMMDYTVMMIQQLYEQVKRSLRVSELVDADMVLPPPEPGKIIIGNSDGTGYENTVLTIDNMSLDGMLSMQNDLIEMVAEVHLSEDHVVEMESDIEAMVTAAQAARVGAEAAQTSAQQIKNTMEEEASDMIELMNSDVTQAGTYRDQAEAFRNQAETFKNQASTSASNSATSANNSNSSASAASISASASASSATAASNSQTSAATSASNASTSASNASTSASAAGTSASAASSSATNASNSATSAAGSASTATTAAGNASTSASTASTYATNANTSANNAATSAASAAASVAALGFLTGASRGDMVFYNGTTWAKLSPDAAGKFLKTGGAGADPSWSVIQAATTSTAGITRFATQAESDAGTETSAALTPSDMRGSLGFSKFKNCGPFSLSAGASGNANHDLVGYPAYLYSVMKCITSDLGYPVGTEMHLGVSGGGRFVTYADATKVYVQIAAASLPFTIINLADGILFGTLQTITPSRWQLYVRAWG